MTQRRLPKRMFLERLLTLMDGKHHWAWPLLMGPGISKDRLKIHYQQEYLVYVRDFPVLLARVHGQNPPPDVRRMLAANIYEEDTGGLSFGRSHPELFNEMMAGLGFSTATFRQARLLPAGARYRAWLEEVTISRDWWWGAAALAVFVEGSVKDRQEILAPSKPKTDEEIEVYIDAHPLIRHHGIARKHMDLIRAHQKVEAGHRQDAYAMVVTYADSRKRQDAVLDCVSKGLALWMAYRDGVAKACGVKRT